MATAQQIPLAARINNARLGSKTEDGLDARIYPNGWSERTQTMNSQSTSLLYQAMRQMMALMLSLLIIPATQFDLYAQAPAGGAYVELNAEQLDQLVAPIALYPDSLVAQILTGATYPDQIAAADTWLNQNMNLPPDQRAAGANAMDWDPAIKGLTAFPSVLDNLAKNTAWTAFMTSPGWL